MNCAEVSILLESLVEQCLTPAQHRLVTAHLTGCDSCASAAYALEQLRAKRLSTIPDPRPGLLSEIVTQVTQSELATDLRTPDRFWLGAAAGGALAAGIVLALLSFNSIGPMEPDTRSSQLSIALNETRDVNVAINSPTEMIDASIRVVLTGTLALAGYEDQSELRWMTDLDAGVNALSLPVTMLGTDGGQVLVEVTHDDHHKIFVITLSGSAPQASGQSLLNATTA